MRRMSAALGLGSALILIVACGNGLEPRRTEGAVAPTTAAADDAASHGDDDIDAAAVAPADDENAAGDDALLQLLHDAVDEALSAGTGRYEMVILFDTATAPADFPIEQVRATGEFAESGLRHRLEVSPDQEPVDETVVDGMLYTVTAGGQCSRVELSDPMAARDPTREIDPVSVLEEVGGVRAEVTDLGRLRIHDTRTTHYSTTLTREEAIVAAPDDRDDLLLGLPASFLDAEQQVDVFVDEDGLPRRIQVATPRWRSTV